MNTSPKVSCALCGNDTRLTISRIYYTHKDNKGYRCLAAGERPEYAVQIRRTFRDQNQPGYTLKVFDNTDSVGFHTSNIGDNHRLETWVYLPGADVRRLIAELTEIADTRGL